MVFFVFGVPWNAKEKEKEKEKEKDSSRKRVGYTSPEQKYPVPWQVDEASLS